MWHTPFPMIVMIVAIVMIASILKSRYAAMHRRESLADDPDALRMKEELKTLRDRVAVLERIATDKEITLEREIERLRDDR
jgi:hypothetical protein